MMDAPVEGKAKKPIKYSRGKSTFDNHPEQKTAASFDVFEQAILNDRGTAKGQQYVCGPLKSGLHHDQRKHPGAETWRLAALTEPRAWLAFDIDGCEGPEVFDWLLRRFEFEGRGVAYTTSSYTPENPRARFILALSREVTRDEGVRLGQAIQAKIESELGAGRVKFDESVYRGEQPIFTPLVGAKTWSFGGLPVDVDRVLENAPDVVCAKNTKQVGPSDDLVIPQELAPLIQSMFEAGESPSLGVLLPPEIEADRMLAFESALPVIPSCLRRNGWRNVIWSGLAHDLPGIKDRLRKWSETCPEKYSAADFDGVCRSFRQGGGVGAGTLYHIAKKYGWKDPDTNVTSQVVGSSQTATTDDESHIRHLASLSALEYERARIDEAKAMGVRAPMLDRLVKAEKEKLASKSGERTGAGSEVDFEVVEPWSDAVDGEMLLDEIYGLISRYVIADEAQKRVATLWIALSWFIEYATVMPLLFINAPEKGCGKSVLLTVISKLVLHPIYASNITAAALFRAIEAWQPTLLVDEVDSFCKNNEEMRGILNAGHVRNQAFLVRTVEIDGNHEPRKFSVWGAKALAGIGHLAPTIESRSIILTMRRKLPGEKSQIIRYADAAEFHLITRKLTRFVEDNGFRFSGIRPNLEGLHNRNADNWEGLFAVAELAGGDWPEHARRSAINLNAREDESTTTNELLLADIRAVFDQTKVDRIHSHFLLEQLCKDDEAPWKTYNRGKELTARQLSKRLAEFGIKPKQIRANLENRNGYEKSQFDDAFARYLGPAGNPSSTTLQSPNGKDFRDFLSSTQENAKSSSSTLNAPPIRDCRVVEDKQEGKAEICATTTFGALEQQLAALVKE